MELIIFVVIFFGIPAIYGFFSGVTTNTVTVDKTPIMNSQNTDQEFFESENETDGWRPTPLTQPSLVEVGGDSKHYEEQESIVPEVSSLPDEVEAGLKALLGELGVDDTKTHKDSPIAEPNLGNQGETFYEAAPREETYDIDIMMETLNEGDIPPFEADSVIMSPVISSPLTEREYHAILSKYGPEFANQITTTPSNGATESETDVMMGRVRIDHDGTIQLTYNDCCVAIRGIGITPDLDGEVIMVKGFFINNNVFMVDETIRRQEARQEVL